MLRVVGVDILGLSSWHRRRIKTEEKAKVVADVWGTYLKAALAFSRKDDLNGSLWENNHFGEVVVWNCFQSIHSAK